MIRLHHQLIGEVLAAAPAEPFGRRELLIALLGVAAPILLGWLLGQVHVGLTIGLGAVLLSGAQTARSADDFPVSPASAALPALLAVAAATVIAGNSWSDAVMVAITMLAGVASGYSRPLAIASIRFVIYLVLGLGLIAGTGEGRTTAAFVFGLGALWNIALRTLLHRASATRSITAAKPTPTSAQRRAHFGRTLRTLTGWQFPLRLAAGLTAASIMRHAWPDHHFQWIVLTVALLTQRPIEHIPVKLLQRVIGTLGGVALAWVVLALSTAPTTLLMCACVFGTLAPIARSRNYLLYSAMTTPLILLVLDYGKVVAWTLLEDRVLATLIGAGIVVFGNLIVERATGNNKPVK